MSLDVSLEKVMPCEAYHANITHNLNKMAKAAGIYNILWRPDEHGFNKAEQIIPILEKGIEDMKFRPNYYKQFESANGWGLYKNFLPWCENYLAACKEHPDATIKVSR